MRQSAVILVFGWLLAPLQFLTAVIVARAVGPEGKGALALLTGLTAVLVSLVGLGLPSGAAVVYRQGPYSKAETVGTALALTGASTLLVLTAWIWGGPRILTAVLSDRDLANFDPFWITLAMIAVGPAALSAVADVVLVAAGAMRTYSIRTASSGLVAVLLTWVLTFQLGWGVAGALASYPLAALFGLGQFAYWWSKQQSWRAVRATLDCARVLLYVGIQQHAIGIIALVAKRVDVFLVASLLTLQDAGFYAAGILIPQAIVSIPRATMWPLVSAFSDSKADVPEIVTRVSRLQVLLMGVIALILLPWGQVIVTTLFGDAFSPSVAPFRWALPGLLFTPVTITVNAILTARARPGLSILSALVGTGVQLVLTLLLLPRWGTSGGAAALSANFVTTALVQLLIMRSEGIDARTLLIATRQDLAALGKALRAQVPAW